MSSEALEAMRRRHAAPTSGPWDNALRGSISGYMEQARLDVLALLDALAVAREREQRAEQQRATYAKAWVDQQYRLQASTAALADLLDTMERGDEYKAFERMTAARAALVDEPAAASAAADEPGETPA